MDILIITLGSAGDVHPFIGIGSELARRGHRVTLYTSDYFEPEVRRAGLNFAAMSTAAEFQDIVEHPDLWHPVRGFKLLYQRVFVPMTPRVYQFIAERYRPGEVGVVSSTLGFGARLAQEKLRVPTVTVHLQVPVFRSVYDTPVFPGLRMGPGMPGWLKRGLFRLMDVFADHFIVKELNEYRKTLGLSPVKRIFNGWLNSPECVLGLFPEWYAEPQPDWPSQTQLTGFPLYDAGAEHPVTPEVQRFLEAGDPPVIFTAGSAMKQGRWFFEAAVEACEILKCRGVLINRFADQVPAALPANLLYTPYAPFSQVFSRGRAVVHHGGIGTTAQVLAAGVPQVIVPLSFDQPDQAMRVERLGVGLQIPRGQFKGPPLAKILRQVLETPSFAECARELPARMNGRSAIAAACAAIEQTFRRSVLSA